ncbi:antibiotic biosynthesis monooxygenase [Thalassospira sp. A40-3]|uniref:putative quinol monooxygenase n=1 Tax=Thalassospira sp. A40-3 TaxID=2785908 RepID=UPI0018CE75C5|nr:putative quinol monooxygenase [Thalassospira sp. A40-3]QPO12811.1 antibiotic biosynthesis monooxygenase [Thalassospira sp. A40-3]
MSKQLTVVATARAKPGMEDELGKRLLALVEPSRAEEGCISYDMHQSNDDPALWLAYETWRSEEDLARHFEMPYLKAFAESKDEVLAQPLEVRKFSLKS